MQLILGDAYAEMAKLPDRSVHCVVTDPPYEFVTKGKISGGGFMQKENKQHFNKIEQTIGLRFDPIQLLAEIQRLCINLNCYIFTNKTLLTKYIGFAEEHNYKWDLLIWHKPNAMPIFNAHHLLDKEYCVHMRDGAVFNSNLGYEHYNTVFPINLNHKVTTHPTEKPLLMVTRMIQISTNPGEVVLDPFMGSGTTGVACHRLKREFIGIEHSPEYYAIAEKRIKTEVSQLNLL